jgi:magnesium chelatase family protein
LLDRIDIHVEVPNVPQQVLRGASGVQVEGSAIVRQRVEQARARQTARNGKANAVLKNREIERYCRLSDDDSRLLEQAIDRLGLSARAYHRIIKVARTVADLAGEEAIATAHLTEAIGYRRLDRVPR